MFKAIFGAVASLASLVSGWFQRRRDDAIREAGRNEARLDQSKDALDAHRRIDDAAARPRGSTADALDKGDF